MQVKSIAECSKAEHSAIFLTFIKLPYIIDIFVLSIFEGPLYTGFIVLHVGGDPDHSQYRKSSHFSWSMSIHLY